MGVRAIVTVALVTPLPGPGGGESGEGEGLLSRKKNLEQVVQKAPAEIGRRDALVVAHDEPPALRLVEPLERRDERKPCALLEERQRETVGQPERVHHELERDVALR